MEVWFLLIAWACHPPEGAVCYPVMSISPLRYESYEVCRAGAAVMMGTNDPQGMIETTICARGLRKQSQGWR